MSEVIWAALIGATATIVGAVIQGYRRHHSVVGGDRDQPATQPDAELPDSRGNVSALTPRPAGPQTIGVGRSPAPPPVESADSLTAEEAIAWLESQGGRRGRTAQPGGSYYETVSRLRFVRCKCALEDTSYLCHEFIARTSRGTCYYIGLGRRSGLITCGPKGYHFYHPEVAECV